LRDVTTYRQAGPARSRPHTRPPADDYALAVEAFKSLMATTLFMGAMEPKDGRISQGHSNSSDVFAVLGRRFRKCRKRRPTCT
jgi:hypothetical protein